MAGSLESLTEEMCRLVLERYRIAAPGGEARPFMALECGSPIPYSAFVPPPGQGPELSAILAGEYMARLANREVRTSSGMIYPDGLFTIDGMYGLALEGSVVDAQSADAALFERAKSDSRQRFEPTLGSLGVYVPGEAQPGNRYRSIIASPPNWFDPSAEDIWSRIDISHETPPAGGRPPRVPDFGLHWRLAPEGLRPMLETPPTLEIVRGFAAATARVSDPSIARRAVAATTAEGLRAWRNANVEMRGNEEPPLIRGVRVALRERPPVIGEEQGPAVTSDGFTASLWTCLVQLTRPWMSGEFLYMRNWHVPAFTRGELSSGTGEGDTAPLGVIPIACVLIKDVSIKANWSDADRRELANSDHMGVFSLLGRQGNFASNTFTLLIPGVQSIAWICEPVPVLPPNDPPTQ